REGNDMRLSIEGRVAIVTGAGTGLGLAIADQFAAAGATVVRAGRTLPEVMPADWVTVDIRDVDQINTLIDGVVDRYGRLDIIVNNAGVSATAGNSIEKPLEEWHEIVDTNLK